MAEKTKIRSLYVAEEVTFGVDPSATGAGYVFLHAEADLPKWGYEMIANALQNERLTNSPPDVGPKKASISVKMPIRGSGTPATAGAAIAAEADLLLKQLFGAVTRGTGSTVTAGGVGATINVTSSAGFTVGGLVRASADGKMYVVLSKPNGTSVTVSPAPAGNITTGTLTAASYYTPVDSGHKSLAFVAKVGSVIVTLLGGRPTGAKISGLNGASRPMLEVTYEFDSFDLGAKAALPAATNRFPAVKNPIVLASPCWVDGVATLVRGVDIDIGIKTEWTPTTEAANGRSGFEVVDRDVKGAIEAYYASGFLTDLAAGADKKVGFACGDQNNGFGFYVPRARWLDVEADDAAGQLGSKVGFAAFDNGSSPEFILSVF